MSGLPQLEPTEQAKVVFEIVGDTEDQIDAVVLGDALRGMHLNPSNKLVENMGGTKKRGEKKINMNEFLKIYEKAKEDKDHGVYEDFIECLKLYDKAENGMVLEAELSYMLLNLGEKLTQKEYDEICADCMDEEDDDGCIPYVPFLARMCGRPVPKSIIPE